MLQADNGREFANRVIESLKEMWSGLHIVHGKPRHSQSQGSVERANQDVEKMLSTWMQSEDRKDWSQGLKFVQLMKNRAHHSGIRRSPYQAMFGCDVKVGLVTLPADAVAKIESEEELTILLENMAASVESGSKESSQTNTENSVTELGVQDSIDQEEGHEINKRICSYCGVPLLTNEETSVEDSFCNLCIKKRRIGHHRSEAKESLEIQAKKMKTNSNKSFPPRCCG